MFTLAVQGQVVTLLSLVTLGAFIWLLVLGFQRHIFWSIAIFVLAPITGLAFAIKYWADARIPYVIFILALGGSWYLSFDLARRSMALTDAPVVSGLVAGDTSSSSNPTPPPTPPEPQSSAVAEPASNRGKVTQRALMDEEESQMARGHEHPALAPPGNATPESQPGPSIIVEGSVAAPTPATTVPEAPKITGQAITFEEATAHVGQRIQIMTKSGLVHEGLLARTDEDYLWLTQRVRGGEFSFEVRREDIAALSVQLKSTP